MFNSTARRRLPHRTTWVALTTVTVTITAAAVTTALTGTAASATTTGSTHLFGPKPGYQQINLVSDVPGAAAVTDPNLVNVWGLSDAPATTTGPGGALWVSDNGTDLSTLYTGGQPGTPAAINKLVVSIPGGEPTGQFFYGGTGFVLNTGGKTGSAKFAFASEDGDITAWNPTGVVTEAVTEVHTEGAVYKGIATTDRPSGPVIFATDFHNNKVDVFDSGFAPVIDHRAFAPVGIPRGFAPFNVAVNGNDVYVSYAKQDSDAHDDVAGPGNGRINVYDKYGHFKRFVLSFGELNSPWAMTIAPAGFGAYAGDLLVGNFGDGRIHAFDPRFGLPLGTLKSANGKDLQIPGLWGLIPGNGAFGAPSDIVFSAGPGDEAHGLLGILRVAS